MKKKTAAKKKREETPQKKNVFPGKKKNSAEANLVSILTLIISAILIIFSIAMRDQSVNFFYKIVTAEFEPRALTEDFCNVSSVIFSRIPGLLSLYLKDYVLSAYIFLLPAILLAARGLTGLVPSSKMRSLFIFFNKNEIKIVSGLLILSFLFLLAIHFFVLLNFNFINDEDSYMMQAGILASGKLFAAPPPMPQFFQYGNVICEEGKWYSKYTIGWPLMLAAGKLLHVEWIMGPLCAALNLLFLYLIGKKLFGRRAGILCIIFGMASPLLEFTGASQLSHSPFGLIAAISIWALINVEKDEKFLFTIAAGIALGFAINVRPADGALLFLGLIPYIGYVLWKSPERKKLLARLLIVVFLMCAGIGVVLLVNKIQNGDYFVMGYAKNDTGGLWGLDVRGNTIYHCIWGFLVSMMRMSIWTLPFLGLLSLFAIRKKYFKASLLYIYALAVIVFCFFLIGMGNISFGTRYYYPVFEIVVIFASGGLISLCALVSKRRWLSGKALLVSFVVGAILYISLGFYPEMTMKIRSEYLKFKTEGESLRNPIGTGIKGRKAVKSIVFLATSPRMNNTEYTFNDWHYDEQNGLVVYYLLPEDNDKLMERFKDREPFVAVWQKDSGKFNIMPYIKHDAKDFDYFISAANYRQVQAGYQVKADEIFDRLLKINPPDYVIRYNLGRYYFEKRNFTQALEIFKKLKDEFPTQDASYFYYARCLGELGKKDDAKQTLEMMLGKFVKSALKERAEDWLKCYAAGKH